ncbi:hypothetical protein AUP68_11073 [Ilyonectria robusta]
MTNPPSAASTTISPERDVSDHNVSAPIGHSLDATTRRRYNHPKSFDDAYQVMWDESRDSLSPRNMPTIRKWIEHELAATRLTSAAGLSTFVLGIAFGPLFTGPLSEHYGRRPIYLISWSMFVILTIPSAVATKMEILIVSRFFDGFAGSTFLSVAGGTIGDIFSRDELQKPMVFVSLAPFVGPSLGPLLGGFINSSLHWRWTYYIIIIWAVVLLLAIALLVPETLHSVILLKKARKLRTETGEHRYWVPAEKAQESNRKIVALALQRPFQLLLLEPMCFILDLYSAILLGILYLFFGTFPAVFRTTYGMNLWQSCLTFLGIIAGMLAGAATNSIWARIRRHLIDEHERSSGETGVSEPEYQLPSAIVGGVLIPIGLFWFSWTTHKTIHWLVPVTGSSLFGCGLRGMHSTLRRRLPLMDSQEHFLQTQQNDMSNCALERSVWNLDQHPRRPSVEPVRPVPSRESSVQGGVPCNECAARNLDCVYLPRNWKRPYLEQGQEPVVDPQEAADDLFPDTWHSSAEMAWANDDLAPPGNPARWLLAQ